MKLILYNFWNTNVEMEFLLHIPEELRRPCHRGRTARVKVREGIERDWRFKPLIIMVNVWSTSHQQDE